MGNDGGVFGVFLRGLLALLGEVEVAQFTRAVESGGDVVREARMSSMPATAVKASRTKGVKWSIMK